MTSEDTHEKTVELLQQNKNFGLREDQVTLLTQEKVPTLIDNEGHFNRQQGQLLLETKPHGHGDVHTLLHLSGLAKKWQQEGRKWITVFQDTNPFALRSFPLLLGISAEHNFDFNTLGVPRKPGEAVGAITTLVHKETKQTLTINIEYNQVESAFKEIGGEPVTEEGFSQFPGNTNCFAIKLETYVVVLEQTQGLISEFINPKYADASKTKFKSSARLECMMQDYPKLRRLRQPPQGLLLFRPQERPRLRHCQAPAGPQRRRGATLRG
jgi:UDP-sugar pyrophosphorylase